MGTRCWMPCSPSLAAAVLTMSSAASMDQHACAFSRRGVVAVVLFALLPMFTVVAQAAPVTIQVGSVDLQPGSNGPVTVRLLSPTAVVKAVANEIDFEAAAPIVSCVVNPAFAATSMVRFSPEGCLQNPPCQRLRAVVASFNGTISDGTELYSCQVAAPGTAMNGNYPLRCSQPEASDPDGGNLDALCESGVVRLETGSCLGDKDNNGSIEATDVVSATLCFAQDDLSRNPVADGDSDGSCEANELVQVIRNFATDECRPFAALP